MTKETEFDLWHYTTAEGLKGILEDRILWATDCRYLNDKSELIYSKSAFLHKVNMEYLCNANLREVENENKGKIENSVEKVPQEIIADLIDPFLKDPITSFVFSFCKMTKKEGQEVNLMEILKTSPDILKATETAPFLRENGLLSQWRGYGKDGGYAIIFDSEKLIKELETEEQFYQDFFIYGDILYDMDNPTDDMKIHLNKIKDFVCETRKCHLSNKPLPKEDEDLYASLVRCMAFLKHKGFEEEKEYRFCIIPYSQEPQQSRIKIRNKGGTLVPYIELFKKTKNLHIKGICVGPHPDKELRAESIKTYLRSAGLTDIEVFCSGIPYIGAR
jgi:hypothetical protein